MLDPILYITNILIITTLICLKNYGYYKIKKRKILIILYILDILYTFRFYLMAGILSINLLFLLFIYFLFH